MIGSSLQLETAFRICLMSAVVSWLRRSSSKYESVLKSIAGLASDGKITANPASASSIFNLHEGGQRYR